LAGAFSGQLECLVYTESVGWTKYDAPKKGSIINITSVAGIRPNRGQANYAASKAAVRAFTQSFAKELAKKKVRSIVLLQALLKPT